MTNPKDLPPDFTDLRRRAEERLAAENVPPEELSRDQAVRLIHELQMHQIELEMQNDELRLSQARLEESRSKYGDLYDFAPVGYLTLDTRDKIVEANLTAATLLGVEHSKLLNRFFSHFLVEEDRRVFRQLMNNDLNRTEWRGEIHLQDGGGNVRAMLLDILMVTDAAGKRRRRISLTDITELKHTQDELRLHKEELEELVAQRTTELIELNQRLREAKDNLEALFQANPLAIAAFDADGNVTNFNPAAKRIFGWSQEEAQGPLPLSIPPKYFEKNMALIERALRGESFTAIELKQQRQDGSLIDVSVSAAPLHDQKGRVRGFVGVAEDITARRQAEEALRKSKARFRRLVEANVVGLAVSDEDKVVEANDEFLHLLGYTQEEMLAGEVKWVEMTPREYIPQDARALYQMRTTGAHPPYEKTLVRKDGSQVPVVVGGALLEEEPLSWVSFVLDISDRKRLEDSLRLSEARFRAIFANASIGIATTDLKGRLQEFNAPFIKSLGYTPTELKNKDFFRNFTHPDDLAVDQELFTTLVKGEQDQYQVEKRFVRKDGRVLWGRVHVSLVRGPRGEPDFTVSLMEDITAQRESQAALAESEARYRSLVDLSPDAIVVHARGRYLFANPAGLRLFGAASPEDLLGRPVLELVHSDSVETVKQRVKAGERLDIREVKILRLDGKVVEVEVAATPITYGGQPAIQVVLRDITERKRAEEETQRLLNIVQLEKEKLTALVKSISDEVWFADTQKKFTLANPSALQEFGLNSTEGVDVEKLAASLEIFRADGSPRPIEESPPLRALQGELIRNLEEIVLTPATGELRYRQVSSSPVRDGSGNLIGSVSVVRDITERKAAEVALRQSEARERARAGELQAILDTAPGIILLAHDPEGRVITGNQAAYELLRRTPGTNLSKSAREDERPDNFRTMKDGRVVPGEELPVQRAAAHGETVRDYEVDLIFDDGTVSTIWGDAVPLLDETGQPRGAVAAFLDITERKQAQEALARKQAEFEAIFHSISDGVVFADPERRILMANPAAETLFGYPLEEMYGRPPEFIYVSREDYEEQGRIRYHTQADQPQLPYEITYRRKDGSVFPAEVRGSQVKDAHGRVLGYVSINRDITERKRAEEALRESREDLNRAQAVAHMGSWRLAVRKNELTWSDETYRIFGIPRGIPLTYKAFLAVVHPEDREYVDRSWTAAWQGETYDIEHRIVVDGTIKWVRELAELEFDSQGHLLGGFGTVQDITERKAAEEALREREAKLSSILATAPVGIGLVFDRVIEEVNQRLCQMTGYAPAELLGKSSRLLYLTQEDFDYVGLEKYRQINECGLGTVEIRWRRKDGATIDICLSSSYLIPGDPSSGVTFTALDITDRKRAEEALRRAYDELEERVKERTAALSRANEQLLAEFQERRQAEKALQESEVKLRYLASRLLTAQEDERRRLAAELHDELGHALLTLKLSLSSISEELLPDQVSLKEEIQDQLKQIKEVIGEVRRLYHDLSPGDVEDLGLTPALETLVENFASLQGQIIFKSYLPDLNGLFSLPVQTIIYRMVQEALTNIGKHAHPEHVTVEAVKEGERVRFTIEDDGQGFNVAQVLGAAGRGVGLAAMEERLRMVDGTLDIHSREQEGTRLSFTVPVLPEGDQP